MPDTVKEVIRKRLARLPADARELLGAASVLGRDFDVATLAALTKTGATARRLRWHRRKRRTSSSPPRRRAFRFSHVLVGETLSQDLPAARREALHLELAALLETRGGDVLAAVAHHRLAALPAGDAGAAASAARRAAERAMAMLAFEDAAAILETAREQPAQGRPAGSRARASSCACAPASPFCARDRAIAGARCARRRRTKRGGSATATAWRGRR